MICFNSLWKDFTNLVHVPHEIKPSLSVFDHFVRLALKELNMFFKRSSFNLQITLL